MKNNKRYFISFTVILSIVMFSFISSVAVFASENIFTDGTELDSYENKKTKEKVIKYYDASKDGKKSIIIPSNGKGNKKDQVSVQKPAEQKDTKNPTNLKDKKIESKKQ